MSLFDEIAKFARKKSTLKVVRGLGKQVRSRLKSARKANKAKGLKSLARVRVSVKKLKMPRR